MMHILHVIDGLCLGGAERMLVDIANATVARGNRASVCVTRSSTDMAGFLDSKVPLHVLHRSGRFDLKALRSFAALVKSERVELLHAHGRSTFSMLALLKVTGWLKVPIVLHDHYGTIELDTAIPTWFRFAGRYCLDFYVGACALLV